MSNASAARHGLRVAVFFADYETSVLGKPKLGGAAAHCTRPAWPMRCPTHTFGRRSGDVRVFISMM
eukprot:6760422-Prymnesium_polylepis.1